MGEIIPWPTRPDRTNDVARDDLIGKNPRMARGEKAPGGEILLFLGVRYERHVSEVDLVSGPLVRTGLPDPGQPAGGHGPGRRRRRG